MNQNQIFVTAFFDELEKIGINVGNMAWGAGKTALKFAPLAAAAGLVAYPFLRAGTQGMMAGLREPVQQQPPPPTQVY